MSSIFVIVYPQPQFAVSFVQRLNHQDVSASAAPAQPGQPDPHFVGRFSQPRFARVVYEPSVDIQVIAEANPHHLGRFQPASFNFRRSLNNMSDSSVSGPAVQQGQPDPHFVGKFSQPKFARQVQSFANDVPIAVNEANPHQIGRFTAAVFNWRATLRNNTWDTSASAAPVQQGQPDPHFIGRFTQPKLTRSVQSFANDVPIAVNEANPHHIGRYTQSAFNYRRALANNGWDTSATGSGPAQGRPDPHFIGRFTTSKFARASFANGVDVQSVSEANPHFVGRYAGQVFNYRPALENNSWAEGSFTPSTQQGESNPHFVGRFTTPIFAAAINSWDGASSSRAPRRTPSRTIVVGSDSRVTSPPGPGRTIIAPA